MFNSSKSKFRENYPVFPIENLFLLARNTITFQHLHFIHFPSIACQDLAYGRLKKDDFKLLALKVVAVSYKRFQIWWFDLETFGILENWSLTRAGGTGRSTVCMWIKQLCNRKVRDIAVALRSRNVSGSFKDRAEGPLHPETSAIIIRPVRTYVLTQRTNYSLDCVPCTPEHFWWSLRPETWNLYTLF